MHPATAVLLILLGTALMLRASAHASPWPRRLGVACALAAVLTAAARIGYGWLADTSLAAVLPIALLKGLPSPSAWALFLFAAALLLIDVEFGHFRPAEYLSSLGGLIVLLAVIAFVYDVVSIQGLPSAARIAPHSLLCFGALSVAILLVRPHRGFMAVVASPYLGGSTARHLVPVVISVPLVIGWLTVEAMRAAKLPPGLAIGLNAVAASTAFAVLTWRHARYLNRLDQSRQEALDALATSQSRLALAQRIVRLANWEQNLVTSEFTTSDEFLRAYGYEPGTVNPSPALFLERIHPDDRFRVHKSYAAAVAARRPFDCDHRIVLPGGTVRFVHARAEPVIDSSGAPRMLGTLQDLTERRALEEQLRQSQKMDAIGQLAGGIAHDFNNLLTIILGYSALARSSARHSPDMLSKLDEIHKAATAAAGLTRQLLAFGRKQALEPRVAHLAGIVENTGRMLRRIVGEGIDLAATIDPSAGRVRIDPSQVEQILMNLVVNARDAMPGGGKLTILMQDEQLDPSRARLHDVPPGRYVLLSVTDTGTGMTNEVLQRIFEPFFTTKAPGKGTGLGLATVYGIVRQSGGYIWCYSEPGAGTTFKILLPSVDEESSVPSAAPEPDSVPGSGTILFVEDETAVRELAAQMLRAAGYHVLAAAGSSEALTAAARYDGPIDVLISDIVLAESSGSQLARELLSARPETKVLFVSGHPETALDRQGALLANSTFLSKPFTAADLCAAVRQTLDPPPPMARSHHG